MGLDIGGNTVTQTSGTLTINTGVPTLITSAGAVMRPNNALFSANGGAAWIYMTAATWQKFTLPTVLINANNCYSGVNGRFTAPVDGRYAFQLVLYLLRDGTGLSDYFHPVFFVNGGHVRNVNTSYANYRIRGHGWTIASYHIGNLAENYDLLAGDYVEAYTYSSVATNRYYPANSRFTGFLMG